MVDDELEFRSRTLTSVSQEACMRSMKKNLAASGTFANAAFFKFISPGFVWRSFPVHAEWLMLPLPHLQ